MKILRTNMPIVVVSELFAEAVKFYERLTGEDTRARLKNPTGSLDIAVVGTVVIIGGSREAIAARREVKAAFVVDSLDAWHDEVIRTGGTIVESPKAGPMSPAGAIGRFMFVRHPDGHLFEYFQPNG